MKCSLFFLTALLFFSTVNIQAEEAICENDLSLEHSSSNHHHRRRSCPPGPTGPAGPTGSTGAEGATGANGTGPTFVYGNFINNGPVALPPNIETFIPLTQDVFSDGISLVEGDNTTIRIDVPGLYLVGYSLTIDGTEETNGNLIFSASQNFQICTPPPPPLFCNGFTLTFVQTLNSVRQNFNSASAQRILVCPEGTTIQLKALFGIIDPGSLTLTDIRFFATRVAPLLE